MEKEMKGKKSYVIIVVLIYFIMILFASFQYITHKFEEYDLYNKLEFTIDVVDSPYEGKYDFINDRFYRGVPDRIIYCRFKNIDDKTFYFSYPDIGKNLDIIITAKNGAVYHYAGPITYDTPGWKSMSPGQIEDEIIRFGGIEEILGYTSSNWEDPNTGSYWLFQPGTYTIYGKYKSEKNSNYEDVLVGTWYSNKDVFTID